MKAMGMLLGAALFALGAAAGARAAEPGADQPAAQSAPDSNDPSQAGQAAQAAVAGDPALREKIEAALGREPSLKNQRVDVVLRACKVDDGPERCNVTLTGTVGSQADRATAERVARIKGVVLIDNRIEVAAKDPAPQASRD
jgi:osmotically-inducible protein OsmY